MLSEVMAIGHGCTLYGFWPALAQLAFFNGLLASTDCLPSRTLHHSCPATPFLALPAVLSAPCRWAVPPKLPAGDCPDHDHL